MTRMHKNISKAIDDFRKNILGDINASKGSVSEPLRREYSDGLQEESPLVIDPPVINKVGPAAPVDMLQKSGQTYHPKGNDKVFIVGADNEVSSAVRVFLEKMGIEVLIANVGSNAKESISVQLQIHDNQFDFAIVILSADEFSLQRKQDLENALLVSNQKTIFELGFLVGKLGRNKVAVIYQDIERFKRPTEYFDLLYVLFNNQNYWQDQLLRQMKLSGLKIAQPI